MRGIIRTGLPALAVASAALSAGVPAATASTLIGQANAPASTAACPVNATYVQEAVSAGAVSYQSPVSGVVTAWATYGGAAATQMKLEILRPDAVGGAYHYFAKQKDALRDITALGALNIFTGLHLPIAAGDYIGVYVPAAGANCLSFSAGAGESYHHVLGDPALDVSTYFNNLQASGLINAAAAIEPDADGDGYGDETQDGCPGNGAVTGACPVTPPASPPPPVSASADKAALLAAAVKRCKRKPIPLARRKCVKRAKKKFA
ncbi:MAG: hypothetical protein QOD60_1423 [Solirubrobacterales bacterium]|nr:hypothetical protein [Solirubrobacterales bacterium]